MENSAITAPRSDKKHSTQAAPTKLSPIIHMPWDDGAITGIFGKILEQKTVKSLCGKRVPFVSANPEATITCHECAVAILERMAGLELIYKHAEPLLREAGGAL